MTTRWMIYGANGYTGELIAREAHRRGLKPVLAGRGAEQIQSVATELGFDYRCFALDDQRLVGEGLRGMGLVLHCAGPFSSTSAPMVEGCLRERAHYLDITGEIAVFEHAHAQHARAQTAGIVVCPGVGFDVIPTDCIAVVLKRALPDATHLALGFESRSGRSPGTAKTTVEGLANGGRVRRDGRIIQVPLAWRTRRIDFGAGERLAMTIPWGDVATAFHSTGIPNIEVYIPATQRLVRVARWMSRMRWLLRLAPVQALLKRRAGTVRSPSAEQRASSQTLVWGEARNPKGDTRTARVRTANGYSLTVTGALAVVEHLLSTRVAGGFYTPSQLMGADFIERLPGSGPIDVDVSRG